MLLHTDAFAAYRKSSQEHLDFAVLVCHAAPQLVIALGSGSPPPKPDHLQGRASATKRLMTLASAYENELARTILITIFGYFESYIRAMLTEIIEFHGGEAHFIKMSERRAQKLLLSPTATIVASRSRLQTRAKPSWGDRYRKHTRLLQAEGYRFPSDLLSSYGARGLVKKASEKKGLRAWEIQDVLEHGLLFPIGSAKRAWLDDVRQHRNDVAHGVSPNLTIRYSLKAASELHAFASRVDRHVVTHFMVIEKFA